MNNYEKEALFKTIAYMADIINALCNHLGMTESHELNTWADILQDKGRDCEPIE